MLSAINCPYLQTDAGFDASVLPTNSVTVSGNTGNDIEAAIASLPASGGIVTIPAGIYTVTDDIVLRDGIFLRGTGIGQTMLISNGADNVVYRKHGENMGVFDLSIDCNDDATRGVFFWYADNVVTDRVEVYNSTRNGIQYRYVNRGTIQKNESYGHGTSNGNGHGIVSDDNQSSDHTAAGALAEFNSDYQGYGSLWTNKVLIVDNSAYANGDYGIDWHGDDSEIACNTVEDNFTGGMKTQDADGLWLHHNTFIRNGGLDYRISAEHLGNAPGALGPNVIWANDFTQESDAAVRFNAPTTNTYLVCNLYANDAEIIVESGATVFVTESDASDSALYDDEIQGGDSLPVSTNYDYLKSEAANICTDSASINVTITETNPCVCIVPYSPDLPPVIAGNVCNVNDGTVIEPDQIWYIDASAPAGGDGTLDSPWRDFGDVDYNAIQLSGDLTVDVIGGPSPTSRNIYSDPMVPAIDDITFRFNGYSTLLGPWQDTPIPQCGDPVTTTPSPVQSGIVNGVSGLQVVALNVVGLQVKSWTNAGIDNLRTSSNGRFVNIEIFNNGFADVANEWDYDSPQVDFCSVPSVPYRTYSGPNVNFPNRPGVWLAGPNHQFFQCIIHDNGQDAFQSRDEGTASSGGNNLGNLLIERCWGYNIRKYNGAPWPNGGPITPANGNLNEESYNYCAHPDFLQIFANADAGRNLQGTVRGITVRDSVIGPGFSNNFVFGEVGRVDTEDVTLQNLILAPASDNQVLINNGSTVTGLLLKNVTSHAGQQAKEHHLITDNNSSGIVIEDSVLAGRGIFGCADVNILNSAAPTVTGSTASTEVTLNSNPGAWNVQTVQFANASNGAFSPFDDYAITNGVSGGAQQTTVQSMLGMTISGPPDLFGSFNIT